jgi:hypothetical protein
MRRPLSSFFDWDHQRVQTVTAIAQALFAVAALIGSVAVTLYVHYSQIRAERVSFNHSLGEAWIDIDLAALSSDELLIVADNLMDPRNKSETDINRRRKRWFAYAVMNVVLARYKAAEDGILEPKEHVKAGCRALLGTLVEDDDVYEITQGHGYEDWMSEICHDLRQEHLDKQRAIETAAAKKSTVR